MSGRVGSHRSPVRYNNRVCKRLQTNKSAGFLFVFEISRARDVFTSSWQMGIDFHKTLARAEGNKKKSVYFVHLDTFPLWHFECIALLLLFLKNEIFSLIKWLKRSWPLFCLSFRCVVLISKRAAGNLKGDWNVWNMIDKISIEFQDCAIIFSATLLPSLENFEKKALLTCCYFVARCGVWCASATLSKEKRIQYFFLLWCALLF